MVYWATKWMVEHKIQTSSDVNRVVTNTEIYRSLQNAAQESDHHEAHPLKLFPNAIVAGRGIGIDRLGANANRNVIVEETADLLRRVWHFFDRVVLQDLAPVIAENALTQVNKDALAGWLESLLLIERVGAGDVCMFMTTASLCAECGSALGHELLSSRGLSSDELAAAFSEDTSITIRREINGVRSARLVSKKYAFDYIAERDAAWFDSQSQESIARSLLWPFVGQSIDQFGMEVFFADVTGVGLGTASAIEGRMLRRASAITGDPANEVAFNIEIPYVSGVPLEILYKIRLEESDAFAQYQVKLRSAIASRLKTMGDIEYESIAREIYRDEIEKPVIDLKRRLRHNTQLLTGQFSAAAVGVAIGAVGLLSHGPTLSATGLGGAFAMAALISGAFKDRSELEARDTFFIFNAGDQPDYSQ